jgi:hypothetical protein
MGRDSECGAARWLAPLGVVLFPTPVKEAWAHAVAPLRKSLAQSRPNQQSGSQLPALPGEAAPLISAPLFAKNPVPD